MTPGLVLVALLVMASGSPAAFVLPAPAVYAGLLALMMGYWFRRPLHLDRRSQLLLGVFAGLLAVHVATFGTMVVPASVTFVTKLLIAVLAARLIPGFVEKLVTVMATLAAISLVFHLPDALGLDVRAVLAPLRAPLADPEVFHVVLHNFHKEDAGRNSGLFWEPGAFAGYLVITLTLVMLNRRHPTRGWKSTVLVLALLSTQSTTGYVAGLLLGLAWALRAVRFRYEVLRYVVPPLVLVPLFFVGSMLYDEVPFLGEKIAHQLERTAAGASGAEINRFGNLVYDASFIAQRPASGWSATHQTRTTVDPEAADLAAGQGNGLTGLLVRFGAIGFVVFVACLYQVFSRMSGSGASAAFAIVLLCLLLFGEQFQNYPLLWCLALLPDEAPRRRPAVRTGRAAPRAAGVRPAGALRPAAAPRPEPHPAPALALRPARP